MSQHSLHRRAFLGFALAGALVALSPRAEAAPSRVRSVIKDERGVTLYLELENAPFPAPGMYYRDATVIVFVPSHFRVGSDELVPTVVHFHGHSTSADRSMRAHELREQLFDSKQNAILVLPQGPVFASDSSAGKLESAGGLERLLLDVMTTLQSSEGRAALGASGIRSGARLGTICLSAHSGGYHAAAMCVRHGGIAVNEVYLFDALYSDVEIFRDWVVAGKGRSTRTRHKLVSYFGDGTTGQYSRNLANELERAGVRVAYERVEGTLTRQDLAREEAVFIRTGLSHGTVTHELNGLRDCLFASGLTRHLRTSWFDNKEQSRRLERRR